MAAHDMKNNKKCLEKNQIARKLLGSSAKVSDLEKMELGEFNYTDEVVKRIALFFKVPTDWLKSGTTKFADMDVVRTPGIGRRITEARMSAGLTFIELSRKAAMGNTSRNVARLEDCVHWPRKSTINRIAAACSVPADYILFG